MTISSASTWINAATRRRAGSRPGPRPTSISSAHTVSCRRAVVARAFVRGQVSSSGGKKGRVEVYSAKRFLSVTGRRLNTGPTEVRVNQPALDDLVARFFPHWLKPGPRVPRANRRIAAADPAPRHASGVMDKAAAGSWSAGDDEELIAKATHDPTFDLLWRGTWQECRTRHCPEGF